MIAWSRIRGSRSPCGDLTPTSFRVDRWCPLAVKGGIEKGGGAGLFRRAISVSMHTYVSLTLAKTPHLPIKRRKVIHIGQPRNRATCDRGGRSRPTVLRRSGHVTGTTTSSAVGSARGFAKCVTRAGTNRARMFSSSLLGEMWDCFGSSFSWHRKLGTPGATVRVRASPFTVNATEKKRGIPTNRVSAQRA